MKKSLYYFLFLLFLLSSCVNHELSNQDRVWIESRIITIADSIYNSNNEKSEGQTEYSVKTKENVLPLDLSPFQVYEQFKSAIESNNLNKAQLFIHSNGVYFYGNFLVKKEDFITEIGIKAESFLMNGEVLIEDNFSNGAGWDGNFYSPHMNFDDWYERGGFFIEGSKIVIINPNPEVNEERLLIELYPDQGEWRVYSVGMWYWSP